MVWRRVSLLAVGLAGGILTATILCVSVFERWNMQNSVSPADDIYCSATEAPINAVSKEFFNFSDIIQGTTLRLERVAVYEGPFLEDGTDREVVDVAALLVRNVGCDEIVNCGILLCFEEICYTFYGERIPPESTVLLIESSGAQYRLDPIISCTGWQDIAGGRNTAAEFVSVEEKPMGTFVITNTSNKVLREIRIFYKNWLSPPDVLVGGVAYSVFLPRLLPGQTELLYPNHYAYGYSQIVSITAE